MQIFVRFFCIFWVLEDGKGEVSSRYRAANHATITLFLQTKTLHSRYDKGGRKRTGKIKEKQEK